MILERAATVLRLSTSSLRILPILSQTDALEGDRRWVRICNDIRLNHIFLLGPRACSPPGCETSCNTMLGQGGRAEA